MKRNIVAIGGGSVVEGHTRALDEELIRLTEKKHPKVVFLPTASSDDLDYVAGFTKTYENLGCEVETILLLSGEDPNPITTADLVCVGGGNTKMMVALWKERGVDLLLKDHVSQGKPVGGVSAGALCWFRVGNSDWPIYEGIPNVNTARLDCLGIVDLVLCPHTKNEGFRLAEFREMMKTEIGVGIGVDDCCALQIRDDEYRIIASAEGSVAHRIEWIDGILTEKILQPHQDFRPLSEI